MVARVHTLQVQHEQTLVINHYFTWKQHEFEQDKLYEIHYKSHILISMFVDPISLDRSQKTTL
jgi:hypothetical protein